MDCPYIVWDSPFNPDQKELSTWTSYVVLYNWQQSMDRDWPICFMQVPPTVCFMQVPPTVEISSCFKQVPTIGQTAYYSILNIKRP